MIMYILSQIFVFLSVIFFIIAAFSKSKIKVLFWLIINDIFFATHYLLLGGLTGSLMVFADILFLIITYILKKKNQEKTIVYVGITFAVVAIVIGIFTWKDLSSILPIIGMTNYFICMGFNNLVVNKCSLALNNITNCIYMFLLKSYVGACSNIILIICSTTATIQTYIRNKKEKSLKTNIESDTQENKNI